MEMTSVFSLLIPYASSCTVPGMPCGEASPALSRASDGLTIEALETSVASSAGRDWLWAARRALFFFLVALHSCFASLRVQCVFVQPCAGGGYDNARLDICILTLVGAAGHVAGPGINHVHRADKYPAVDQRRTTLFRP
jgi:hypothetical protein